MDGASGVGWGKNRLASTRQWGFASCVRNSSTPALTGSKLRQKETLMDAREYFNYVVLPKYNEFVQSPNDFRLLESALYSMDTVAERLGLHQLGYAQVSRETLYEEAKKITWSIYQSQKLALLQQCAQT
jgi:hypothetical protein